MEWTHRKMAERLGISRKDAAVAYRKAIQLDPCSYCGAPNPGVIGEIDHIHPRSKGGPNHWSNYANACGFCNAIKSDRTMLEWLLDLRDICEFGPPGFQSHHVTFGARPDDEPQTIVYRRLRRSGHDKPLDFQRQYAVR